MRDLKPFIVGISDFDIEVSVGEGLEQECELLDDGTGLLHIVLICASVGEPEHN